MTGPLVSIIVAVHNGERFLTAAIESILAQDYEPLETIVVDDGSDDATPMIARGFAGVTYLRQEHQGPAAARNAGIAAARGEFLAFHDADDLMAASRLSVQVCFLLAHPEIGCALGRQEIFLEPGVTLPGWLKPDPILGDLGGVQHTSAMVRRTVLDQVGGFDSAFRIAEDTDWLFRMRAAGIGIALVPEIVTRRRIHGQNLSYNAREASQALLRSLKQKLDRQRSGGGPTQPSS